MVEQYSAVGSEPVALDTKKLQAKGIRTIRATLISSKKPAVHDPERLGKVIMVSFVLCNLTQNHISLEYYLQRDDH